MSTKVVTRLGAKMTLDPNDQFPKARVQSLLDALGLLPQWINPDDERPMREQLDEKYGFGLYEMKGGTVSEDGSYKYPRDPVLHPIARTRVRDETVFFYQYGIVCIRNEKTGDTFMTRMD